MAQNQNFGLLKMMVEVNDQQMYQLCNKLREEQNIPQGSPKIPHGLQDKVEKRINHVLTSCKKDIDENIDDFLDYLGKRIRGRGVRNKLFSISLYTSLQNMKIEKEDDQNEI